MSNAIDQDIKEKELEISNSSIKIHIPSLSVLLYLSALNSTKQSPILVPVSSILDPTKHDLQSSCNQTKPKEDQYLASSFSSNQFATDIKSNNKGDNAVTTIERLFLNIKHRSFYKR